MRKFYRHNEEQDLKFCQVVDGIIQSDILFSERELVRSSEHFLHIQNFDMTPETVMGSSTSLPWSALAGATSVTTSTAASLGEIAYATPPGMMFQSAIETAGMATMAAITAHEMAREWWEKDKKISGSIFLTPKGVLIWISDIDLKYFEEIKEEDL